MIKLPSGKCDKCGNENVNIELYGDINDIRNAQNLCYKCVNDIVIEMSKSERIRDVKRFHDFKERLQELIFTKTVYSYAIWQGIEDLWKSHFGEIENIKIVK